MFTAADGSYLGVPSKEIHFAPPSARAPWRLDFLSKASHRIEMKKK